MNINIAKRFADTLFKMDLMCDIRLMFIEIKLEGKSNRNEKH